MIKRCKQSTSNSQQKKLTFAVSGLRPRQAISVIDLLHEPGVLQKHSTKHVKAHVVLTSTNGVSPDQPPGTSDRPRTTLKAD